MTKCRECGVPIPSRLTIDGVQLDLRGRQRCLTCLPHRALRKPRKPVDRPKRTRTCASCGRTFVAKVEIDGKMRMLHRRRFCLVCSRFGAHNTSKTPPGELGSRELATYRRRRKAVTTYRSQKKRRKELKAELTTERGGRCLDCGYSGSNTALEFHHRDAASKEFAIGSSSVSRARLWAEAAKCDLVCANCHRARHAASRSPAGGPVVEARRRTKQRAVELLGGRCQGCGSAVPVAAFEFHHLDAGTKEFAISADGVPRRWALIVAELGKCVLLCANCHREVHAGVREIFDDGLLGLAERAAPYRCAALRRTEDAARRGIRGQVIGAVDAQRIPVSAWSSTSV